MFTFHGVYSLALTAKKCWRAVTAVIAVSLYHRCKTIRQDYKVKILQGYQKMREHSIIITNRKDG